MNHHISLSRFVLLLALSSLGCDDLDVFTPPLESAQPSGIIEGTVTYSGPPPCTQNGHVVGAAVLLAFETRLLPPPEGLGTSAASIDVIPGDELFAGVRAQLPQGSGGKLTCPSPGTGNITVSGSWGLGPLPGGTYQIRGFYDLDGDFDPTFSISNLPSKGDVGGGAIDNVEDVLKGLAPPRYREITLGVLADGQYVIPDTGARISGVAATLGLPLPLERPVFHVSQVLDDSPFPATRTPNTDPNNVVIPADFQFGTFTAQDALGTQQSLVRLKLSAGVPATEASAAAQSPFFFPLDNPTITFTRQDVNGDGIISNDQDHIPETPCLNPMDPCVPALFPVSIFAKLSSSDLVNQSEPAVVIQGLTIYQNIIATAGAAATLNDAQPEAFIGIRPAALCLYPTQPEKGGVLVISHETDGMNNQLIADPAPVEQALSNQFGRDIKIAYGCLPQGRYAMNLIYETGQAWTIPNEAGICAPPEEPKTATQCGSRARLPSQSVVLTVGPPTDPSYCSMNPTPGICFPSQ